MSKSKKDYYLEEEAVAREEAPAPLCCHPADDEVGQKERADDELDVEVEVGEAGVVPAEDFARHGGEQHQTARDVDRPEDAGEPFACDFFQRHASKGLPAGGQNRCQGPFLRIFADFYRKYFARSNFSLIFALAFSNGGIAQLVRAHDS